MPRGDNRQQQGRWIGRSFPVSLQWERAVIVRDRSFAVPHRVRTPAGQAASSAGPAPPRLTMSQAAHPSWDPVLFIGRHPAWNARCRLRRDTAESKAARDTVCHGLMCRNARSPTTGRRSLRQSSAVSCCAARAPLPAANAPTIKGPSVIQRLTRLFIESFPRRR